MFRVKNKDIRTTVLQWRRSDVFIVNFEHVSHPACAFIVNFEQVNDWVTHFQSIFNSCKSVN